MDGIIIGIHSRARIVVEKGMGDRDDCIAWRLKAVAKQANIIACQADIPDVHVPSAVPDTRIVIVWPTICDGQVANQRVHANIQHIARTITTDDGPIDASTLNYDARRWDSDWGYFVKSTSSQPHNHIALNTIQRGSQGGIFPWHLKHSVSHLDIRAAILTTFRKTGNLPVVIDKLKIISMCSGRQGSLVDITTIVRYTATQRHCLCFPIN